MKIFKLIASYILVTIILSSCSFVGPLYKDDKISDELSRIEIEEVETLQNTELYYQLSKLFGTSHDTKYLLHISAENKVTPLVVTSRATVVAQNVEQLYSYRLIDKTTDRVLTEGKLRTIGSYNSLSTPYASYTQERHTKNNLAQSAAEDLRMRLIMYFSKKTS
ncbi:MAG: hypothetical protein RLZZ59_116 [Pseudomonadota bacterium]|jgi:hypothetical protein